LQQLCENKESTSLKKIDDEGFNDQWAFPLPTAFLKPDDLWQTLNDFFGYCNIIDKPYIERGSTP
jgi:hypothetical protein